MRKMANKRKGKSDAADKTVPNNEQENGEAQHSETESDATKKSRNSKKVQYEEEADNEEPADSTSDKKRKRTSKADETIKDEQDEEYEVESVVDSRQYKGKRQFKIRWKGYGEDNDTWEFEDNLKCPEIIEVYLKENPEKDSSKSQKRGRTTKEKDAKKKKIREESSDSDDNNDSGESVYEVQKIMEVRFKKNGKKEFLIHWKGFQHKHDSWEPEEHLSCPELIKDILEKAEKAKDIPARELRADPKQTKRLNLAMQQKGRRLSRRHQGKER
ncbi:chromobox protein homolog 5-like isoform X2 [Bacillus rossius redtenbacheri]